MKNAKTATKGGLEGVAAADSAICKIDGKVGELRYRGYLITELAEHASFLETTLLLLNGELPTRAELEQLQVETRAGRGLPRLAKDVLRLLSTAQAPMGCLRTVVSALSGTDVPSDADDLETNRRRGIGLVAKLPTILAGYSRLRAGRDPIEPRDDLSHSANFLYMLTGEVPNPEEEHMMDVCLVLHAEHGFNASTFAGRVTAATLSDMYSAITSAIGALKGPLHGGANTAVMNMLVEIDSVDKVEAHIDAMLARREKIMGFGHRVYKAVDPRALILKEFSRRLASAKGDPKWFEMSEKIEELMKARKGIDMNVDFYSASTYSYMGIEPDLFTGIFAISRISGWVAHVLEQYTNNRLIRPRSNYIGYGPRQFVSIDKRR